PRKVLALTDLVRRERRAVTTNPAGRARLAGDGHVDRPRVAAEPPESRGRTVAEDGAGAEGEDRRHPPSLAIEGRPADGEHSGVDPMQASRPQPAVDPARPKPDLAELRPRHHPVLPLRKRRDLVVPRPRLPFASHIDA